MGLKGKTILESLTNFVDSINKEEALKEISKEKMVTLTVLVPESLRANFKVQTIRNKTNVTTVIVNYIREYISK
jgi:chorismate mutase